MAAAQQSSDFNSTMAKEIEELLDDSSFFQRVETRNEVPGDVNESASLIGTTPDPLNTAFINEETINVNDQHNEISLSQQQQQSQTTKDTSPAIHDLISTTIEKEEHKVIDLRTPIKTMISIGTMPRTPTMISTGTMPITPTMKSTGTMPRTPTIKSTGTMPKTPTMISTGTMPRTPSTTASSSTPSTIDLVSPIGAIIELSSPDTPTTPGHPNNSSRHLPPQ